MREHRIVSWCDGHEAGTVEATRTVVVGVDGPPRRVDLCEECFDAFASRLAGIAEEAGVAPDTAPDPAPDAQRGPSQSGGYRQDPGTCLVCGKTYLALGQHYAQTHGLTSESTRDGGKFVCPVCDKRFDEAQRLAHHAPGIHGKRLVYLLAERVVEESANPPKRRRRTPAA